MKTKEEFLNAFPIHIEFAIDWGDMDAFNHVNNVRYFRYFENVRIIYFEKSNMIQHMKKSKIGPILGEAKCRFRAPLTYPDTISVAAKVSNIGEDRFTMEYAIYSNKLNKIAATGDSIVVYYDYKKNAKTHIPEEIKKAINALENI